MPTTTLDFTPLTTPVSKAEVAAWRNERKAAGINKFGQDLGFASRIGGAIGLMFVAIPVVIVLTVVFAAAGDSARADGLSIMFAALICAGLVGFVVWRLVVHSHERWATWLRMDRFARANNMSFSPGDPNPIFPGMIFQAGNSRRSIDHLTSTSSRYFDLGNYQWITGSGKNSTTHTWGFVAFHLDRRLPNMVLDARSNNTFFGSNLPVTLAKNQVLSLEGDFDKSFTLYCPKEYEQDALYVFTPDLMGLLVDEAAPFDVEIVDDWMFLYSLKPFRTGDPATYARIFHIIDTVGAKTLTQTDRYVDDRVGNFAANVVAPQGARLKRSVSLLSIVIGVVVVGFWLWSTFSDVMGN